MAEFKVIVSKEHPLTKELFPLGFETICKSVYLENEIVYKGFWTSYKTIINGKFSWVNFYVEPKIRPKGEFIGVNLESINKTIYDGDFFYRATGRSFTEFFEKVF
jgi:hypothetical protein